MPFENGNDVEYYPREQEHPADEVVVENIENPECHRNGHGGEKMFVGE
jgi:hypothetical protein